MPVMIGYSRGQKKGIACMLIKYYKKTKGMRSSKTDSFLLVLWKHLRVLVLHANGSPRVICGI